MTTEPLINATPNLCQFDWPSLYLRAIVSRIRDHRDGRVTAEVTITTSAPAYLPLLHQAQLNITSSAARDKLERILEGRYNLATYDATWEALLEQLCYVSLNAHRKGEPVEELWSNSDIQPLQYILKPFILKGKPTVIFGDGGVGKGLFVEALSIIVTLPWTDNPLGLEVNEHRHNVLYLDWETDRDDIAWRLKGLQQGFGLPDVFLHYRRCARRLADEVDSLQEYVAEKEISIVIIDSLGPASGADLTGTEPAISFFASLRDLHVSSLIVAHNSKDPLQKTKSIYGNAFFTFHARSVFEMRKSQTEGEDELSIGLFHRKSNLTKKFQPMGFHFKFKEDEIILRKQDLRDVEELATQLPLSTRIQSLLREGALGVKDISECLEIKDGTIRTTLNRLLKADKVVKIGDDWGLAYKNLEDGIT